MTNLLILIAAALLVAYAVHRACGCYRRHRDELHDHLQALCEFHPTDDTRP